MTASIAGTWISTEIEGKQLDVYEPRAPADHGRVVLFLHGHGLHAQGQPRVFGGLGDMVALCLSAWAAFVALGICREFDAEITPLRFAGRGAVIETWGRAAGHRLLNQHGRARVLQLAYRKSRGFPWRPRFHPRSIFRTGTGAVYRSMRCLRVARRRGRPR
jgi:hypothetical protein